MYESPAEFFLRVGLRVGLRLVPMVAGAAVAIGMHGCAAAAPEDDVEEEGVDYDETSAPLSAKGGYVGKFNRAGQGHADVCVKLKNGSFAPLRYPDFSETGYLLTHTQLVFTASGACNDGYVQLDAREYLETPQGRLLFHRGGYGYQKGGDVKYGHIWLGDIADHVDVESSVGNGGPCPASKKPETYGHYRIRPKALPSEMHYCKTKGDCDTPALTNGYTSYGDPAQQGSKPLPNVHYTYLVWSWINVAGGGVVRALLKNDDAFHRCHVPAIKLATVTENGKANGWVKAMYGKTRQGGNWIYGWTVHSHKFQDQPVVWHVARMPEYY